MKALSIKQPWASLIAEGHKTIETRTWATDYRGPLLICSSKGVDEKALDEFREMISSAPCGFALAVVDLVDCVPMTYEHEQDALCGVYSGAFAWRLKRVRRIRPFRVRGKLGLFEVEVET